MLNMWHADVLQWNVVTPKHLIGCLVSNWFVCTLIQIQSCVQGAGHAMPDEDDWSSSGDVKYHLGTSCVTNYPDGRQASPRGRVTGSPKEYGDMLCQPW